MSSLREAAILGSSCRREPAAALRGLANRASPLSSRSALSCSKLFLGMNTSPRTMREGSASGRRRGMEGMVLRFSVTSSPTWPSPRVAPRTKRPFSYSSATDNPSTLGSTSYSTPPVRASWTRWPKSASSSKENTSWRLSRGTRWWTSAKPSATLPPTRWVGESGVISSGYLASSSSRRRSLWSKS